MTSLVHAWLEKHAFHDTVAAKIFRMVVSGQLPEDHGAVVALDAYRELAESRLAEITQLRLTWSPPPITRG